ncbi:hypothetical protein PoB_006494500 [Plakobranchus ocellatus]|uniref:Uncharacterized protein n=1 Tax=Plakobranchus ocellatus TaxID=259542 RepID=A0AAV4D2T9_9GAST|nr:hypothetical protein PoB_006494500 [Plakobranchus ocellatus]
MQTLFSKHSKTQKGNPSTPQEAAHSRAIIQNATLRHSFWHEPTAPTEKLYSTTRDLIQTTKFAEATELQSCAPTSQEREEEGRWAKSWCGKSASMVNERKSLLQRCDGDDYNDDDYDDADDDYNDDDDDDDDDDYDDNDDDDDDDDVDDDGNEDDDDHDDDDDDDSSTTPISGFVSSSSNYRPALTSRFCFRSLF